MKTSVWSFRDKEFLQKLRNDEIYYLVSSLLSLGDSGFGSERLYLSFDQNNLGRLQDFKFLFLCENIVYNGSPEVTEFTLGKIDNELDNIEIYTGHCDPKLLSPDRGKIDTTFVITALQSGMRPNVFRPISLLDGISRFLAEKSIDERDDNDLFNIRWHDGLPVDVRHEFNFGTFGPMGTDFSGNYFLIAQPEAQSRGGIKINFFQLKKIVDEQANSSEYQTEIEMTQHYIDSGTLQEYADAQVDKLHTLLLPSTNNKYEMHKERIVPIMTQTILSLLTDLTPEARVRLLENETPEELVEFCKEKYDEEFDLHVKDLGIAGAHEIAWQEALAILQNEQL